MNFLEEREWRIFNGNVRRKRVYFHREKGKYGNRLYWVGKR